MIAVIKISKKSKFYTASAYAFVMVIITGKTITVFNWFNILQSNTLNSVSINTLPLSTAEIKQISKTDNLHFKNW